MVLTVTKPDKDLSGEIPLPASKSISNRVLIINALSCSSYRVQNLSYSDDTRVMERVLNSDANSFDIGHAGTAMRFLTAFLSKIVGRWELTGSERMKQRPIGILVDALNKLGARIEYSEKRGFPPLRIFGSSLQGGVIELDGSESSQYISALLMIAPTIKGGLVLRLKNRVTSRPYINLTLGLMEIFGVCHVWRENEITVEEQEYTPVEFRVDSDWSGASYWYQMAALSEKCNILLRELRLDSLQGDSIQAEWFNKYFGVKSEQESNGVRVIKTSSTQTEKLSIDFIENPDLAQTFAVLCVCRKMPFHFTGLHTLKIKETDRILALQNELSKFGATLVEPTNGELAWDGSVNIVGKSPLIETYHDHRMALAFSSAAISVPEVRIVDPDVVTKSYPGFYEGLRSAGFKVE